MKKSAMGLVSGLVLSAVATAQVVAPAHPKKFATRPISGGTSGGVGVDVLPRDGAAPKKARYTTHIVLSTSRLWQSTEGKLLEGKLIAFEDLVVEAPEGAAPPPNPAPPDSPTVVRDGKIRLLVKQKTVELPLSRLSTGDVEFVEQVRKAYTKKAAPTP